MLTTFCDSQRPLVQGFNFHHDISIKCYCQTLQHLLTKLRDDSQGKVSDGIIWLHNYFHPHTAQRVQDQVNAMQQEVFKHPTYDPDLSPCECHIKGSHRQLYDRFQ